MVIDSHEHVILPTDIQIQKLDQAGVDKAILFSTTPHVEKAKDLAGVEIEMQSLYRILSGSCTIDERLDSIKQAIKELCAVIESYPNRFLGFGSVPLGLTEKTTAEWIEKYIISNNLKGVGEITPGSEEQVQLIETIFKSLSAYPNFPIWVHTFNPVTPKGIKILMDLCIKYPRVPVVFGHLGGSNWMDVIKFAKENSNVYLDLSAAFTTLATKIAINELPNRCLYSSDAPYGEPFLYKQMIEFVSPSSEVSKLVLGENISNLLNIVE